jgi:prolyl-tRNA synthetase
MRFSRALIPTLKEAPTDAHNVSTALLLRAGYVRRVGAGIYEYLPLGLKVLRRVEGIVREEMDRAGALEILMPAILPKELFEETGRWERFGDTLFRMKDRKGGDYHLGPTHEEVVTDIARREIRSYRDLPKNLYQVQAKYRDEPRARGGLLRCREFVMKDAYSFDADEAGARQSYETMRVAYRRIFDRMGLNYRMVQADSGAMGGSTSAEFQVLADSGEDAIVACTSCEYAANVEVAETREAPRAAGGNAERAKVHTPKVGTIEDVAKFLKLPKERFLKSIVVRGAEGPVLVVVRGDHEINEVAVAKLVGTQECELAGEEEVKKATGAAVGFAGPVGFGGKILVDFDAAAVVDGVTGANETDHHLVNVTFGRDFEGQVVRVRKVGAGDACPKCSGTLAEYKGIEAGHIFILGTHYSAKMNASFLDKDGVQKTLVMGCYGIGVSRLVATTIEQHNDASGIVWPYSLAPYHVHLCTLGVDEAVMAAAQKLHDDLIAAGVEVLWDDRDERPGVKFKDADLVGCPLRVTLGGKSWAEGVAEVKARTESDPKKAEKVPVAALFGEILDWAKKQQSRA